MDYEVQRRASRGWLVVAVDGERRFCAAVRDTKRDAEAEAERLRHTDPSAGPSDG